MTIAATTDSGLAGVPAAELIGFAREASRARESAERRVFEVAGEWARSHEVHGPPPRPGPDFPDTACPESAWAERTDLDEVPDALLSALERAAGGPVDAPTRVDVRVDPRAVAAAEADDADRRAWRGLPELAWDCVAPFAAALGRTTTSGRVLLRQALIAEHRLPRVHASWQAGATRVETARVRQVADAVAGQPDDVCAWVDIRVAQRLDAGTGIGPVVLARLLDAALAELHAEERELKREEELTARYARLQPSVDPVTGYARSGPDCHGLAEFVLRGDWPDVRAFDDTIAALAEALRTEDGPEAGESLDVRRSIAVGILADPARALVLLGAGSSPDAPTSRRSQVLIAFHLAADAVAGSGLTVRRDGVVVDVDGRPTLTAAILDWIGRRDAEIAVRPVVHCGGCADCGPICAPGESHPARRSYRPTTLDRERVALHAPACVFPYCTRPTARTDCDHIVAFDPDDPDAGPTCPRCNLAPLCRHHHRYKTHAGWRYRQPEPGTFTWTEPHGQSFTVTRSGTRDTTPDAIRPG